MKDIGGYSKKGGGQPSFPKNVSGITMDDRDYDIPKMGVDGLSPRKGGGSCFLTIK